MTNSIDLKDIERQIDELEHRHGKWVTSYSITPDGVSDVEFADIGPFDDYVINVWNCRAELRKQTGKMKLEPVGDMIPDDLRELYEDWLLENIEAQGGAINFSGIYRVVLGMPVAIANALGIVPEMEMWDEEDDEDM